MEFVRSESDRLPEEVEKLKDGRFFVRKNIRQEVRPTDNVDNVKIMYVYEESIMTETEYAIYSFEAKRESEIVDEYTLSLIEGGVL